MRPPRALWVPFPLGRPFGAPDNPDFQRRVLLATLQLLTADSGPVLADFPDDAPGDAGVDAAADGGWACPVSFPAPPVDPADLGAAVAAEIGRLAPWYEAARCARGRTTVGVSAFSIEAATAHAARFLEAPPPETGAEGAIRLKRALEDLKAFYSEAAAAQPGARGDDVADWLWRETALGRLMARLGQVLAAGDDAELRFLAERSLVPRAQGARRD